MKELISLNGDGNKVRFIRGNDGDICITFDIPAKQIFSECIRVGCCHSGGQDVPGYVMQALHRVVDALDRWEKEQDEPYKMSQELGSNIFNVSERILKYGEGALFVIVHSYLEKNKSEYPDFMNGTDSYAFGMKEGWNAAFTAIINGLFGKDANPKNCEK